ncbi:MAG: hypothetical protein JJE10_01830 [Thermoleophilia bacterium]|nr:hypothetical protein [Thermoleophilia bacterium]
MAKEVFDQARPRSLKAQRFAEAFIGCDEWVVPPRKRRRSQVSLYDAQSLAMPPLASPEAPQDYRRAA